MTEARGPHPRDPGPPGAVDPRLGCARMLFWIFIFMGTYAVLSRVMSPAADATAIAYSTFRDELTDGNVVTITVRGDRISGMLRAPIQRVQNADTTEVTEFQTHLPSFGDAELLSLLQANDVEVEVLPEPDSSWLQLLGWIFLPLLLFGLLALFIGRRMAGRAQSFLSIGKSGARKYEKQDSATTFDDVAGAASAKRELQEIVQFLKEPEQFHRLGAEVPKGVLLVGPPGTGKTLLARAVAGEAGVSFFIITGSDFMEMFVGVGAKRVRDLFEQAKNDAPSIIFIDELDSIGRHRGAGLGGGHDEREQTLNQLLSELDGFEPAEDVIVMAATNRPDILDPALLRPGRFDRRITVDLPSASERLEILRLHARDLPLDPSVDLEPMAQGTPGYSGADLRNLLNEAALSAARKERTRIQPEDLEEARDRVLLGLKREGLVLTEEELRLLAYHEGGHAIVGATLPNTDRVHKVTIIPRGRSMGSTHQLPERERYVWRREDVLDRLALALGGRAAERLVFGTVTSGAEDDLRMATRLARRMVLRWGMSSFVGPFAADQDGEVFLGEQLARPREFADETARHVDEQVAKILDEAEERARRQLEKHRAALDCLAQRLLDDEEVTGDQVDACLAIGSESKGGASYER